jgi:hypothetical protein
MEYWWENIPPETAQNIMPLQAVVEGEAVSESQYNSVGETLQKLISIAKLNFSKAKVSEWLVKCSRVFSFCQ